MIVEKSGPIDLVFVHVSEPVEISFRQEMMSTRKFHRALEHSLILEQVIPMPLRVFVGRTIVCPG